MPSSSISSRSPPTPSRSLGISTAPLACARRGKTAWKSWMYGSPRFGGRRTPATTRTASGNLACTRSRMPCRLPSVWSRGRPRRPSLPPRARTKTSTGGRRTQSMRRSPAAVVSPARPALAVRTGQARESSRAWIRAGKACSGSTPYPAVRESPKNRTVRGSGAGSARAATASRAHRASVRRPRRLPRRSSIGPGGIIAAGPIRPGPCRTRPSLRGAHVSRPCAGKSVWRV